MDAILYSVYNYCNIYRRLADSKLSNINLLLYESQNRQILIYSFMRVKMTPGVKIQEYNLLHYFYSSARVIFTPLVELNLLLVE